MKRIKTRIWARIFRVFSSIGFVRAIWAYFLFPTLITLILIALLFLFIAALSLIISHGQGPIANLLIF